MMFLHQHGEMLSGSWELTEGQEGSAWWYPRLGTELGTGHLASLDLVSSLVNKDSYAEYGWPVIPVPWRLRQEMNVGLA